jgi:large subunit ribosomal protein L20
MARVKRGVTAHKRHKRLLNAAEGRMGTKSKLIKPAREASLHAMAYATRDRKQRKRQMRELWIIRINAAAREHGLTYGQFISGLKEAGITLDRKSLSELAIASPAAFATLARQAKSSAKPVAKPAAKPVAKPAAKAARA